MKAYTGIGSRATPTNVQTWMTAVAKILDQHGWVLRSGGAAGADTAFEAGHRCKEIYLPWNGFNNRTFPAIPLSPAAFEIAAQYHPAWGKLNRGVRMLMARNSYQLLGADLKSPSQFVLCWTPEASGSGGTGQALRIAAAHQIPVLDLGAQGDWLEKTHRFLTFYAPEAGLDIARISREFLQSALPLVRIPFRRW